MIPLLNIVAHYKLTVIKILYTLSIKQEVCCSTQVISSCDSLISKWGEGEPRSKSVPIFFISLVSSPTNMQGTVQQTSVMLKLKN